MMGCQWKGAATWSGTPVCLLSTNLKCSPCLSQLWKKKNNNSSQRSFSFSILKKQQNKTKQNKTKQKATNSQAFQQ